MESSFKEKVMLIDDDPGILELLVEELAAAGYESCTYNDGQKALDEFSKHNIFLVITDYSMPNLNGLEFTKELRNQGRDCPCAILSGFADREMAIGGIRSGVDDIFDKPPKINEILTYVAKCAAERMERIEQEIEETKILVSIFSEEAREHLKTINDGLLALENDPGTRTSIDLVFRALHSIKGASRSVGLIEIGNVSHAGEEVLAAIRANQLKVSPLIIDTLLQVSDVLGNLLDRVGAKHIEVGDLEDKIVQLVSTLSAILHGEESVVEQDREAAQEKVPRAGANAGVTARATGDVAKKDQADNTLRISEEKLNRYIHSTGELMIARNFLVHAVKNIRGTDRWLDMIRGASENINLVAEELQASAMSMRAVSMKTIFQRLPRIVRDLSRALHKRIALKTIGEELEVDKKIAEAFSDALIHMVRNSVDHGIEMPADRKKRGKNEEGIITIEVKHDGNYVQINILDDGAGINVDVLKRKAVEKGLIDEAHAANMPRKDALKLIFHAGLSTAKEVTDISGRGVGMDVVLNSIKDLGGSVDVSSEVGVGSTIAVRLPIPSTLMVTRVIPVLVDNVHYGLPAESVLETLKVRPDQLSSLHSCQAITVRGELTPLVRLSTLLHSDFNVAPKEASNDLICIAVITTATERYGVIVDGFGVLQELVVKKLPGEFSSIAGLAGASISNEGDVMLLIDVETVMEQKKTAA